MRVDDGKTRPRSRGKNAMHGQSETRFVGKYRQVCMIRDLYAMLIINTKSKR